MFAKCRTLRKAGRLADGFIQAREVLWIHIQCQFAKVLLRMQDSLQLQRMSI